MGKLKSSLNWHQVWALYCHEMRSAVRDRTIVLNSVLVPIFLFPFLFWVALTGVMYVAGQSERVRSRIAVESWPAGHEKLRRTFELSRSIEIVPSHGTDVAAKIKRGELDALVQFVSPDSAGAALQDNFS